jgi:hypothetical protein
VGGGVDITRPVWFANNIVAGNEAPSEGGGVYLAIVEGDAYFIDNTIADNHGLNGIYIDVLSALYGVRTPAIAYTPTFTNTIIAGNEGPAIETALSTTVSLAATLWYGNGSLTAGPGTVLTGTVNVYADPRFMNASAWDYHLRIDSPARDAGLPVPLTTDIDGEPRPFGGGYDLGADEWQGELLYLPLILNDTP